MMDSRRDELLVQIALALELLLTETSSAHNTGTRDTTAMMRQVGALKATRERFEKMPGG